MFYFWNVLLSIIVTSKNELLIAVLKNNSTNHILNCRFVNLLFTLLLSITKNPCIALVLKPFSIRAHTKTSFTLPPAQASVDKMEIEQLSSPTPHKVASCCNSQCTKTDLPFQFWNHKKLDCNPLLGHIPTVWEPLMYGNLMPACSESSPLTSEGLTPM